MNSSVLLKFISIAGFITVKSSFGIIFWVIGPFFGLLVSITLFKKLRSLSFVEGWGSIVEPVEFGFISMRRLSALMSFFLINDPKSCFVGGINSANGSLVSSVTTKWFSTYPEPIL